MNLNCLLAGVGGQGTVLASKIIAQTAINQAYPAHTSETIGMAQRGGSVVSHVRLGQESCSPAIPKGQAEVVIGFEPAEAVRNISYLHNEGTVLLNVNPIMPVTASLGVGAYEVEKIISFAKQQAKKVIVIDGNALCKKAGSAKVLNVIMLGVAIKAQLLPFTKADIIKTLEENLPPRFLKLNRKAFDIGYSYDVRECAK